MTRILLKNVHIITLQEVQKNYGIFIQDGTIETLFPMTQCPRLENAQEIDGQGAWALPGLIDAHIHGMAGYGPEQGSPQALWAMSEALAKQGVTSFCPTLYCAQPAALKALLLRLTPALGKETGAHIAGFHLEGPFISPHKPGVMKPQDIAAPDVPILEELYDAAQGHIISMTLAPELKNITPVIDFCLRHHIVAQAGHTNATYEEFEQGVALGITHATHAFNAMSPLLQRAPGAAGAVLTDGRVSCEIIGDGVHVHPALIAFLRTVKPEDKLVLVTDALTPTAQAKGPFIANGDEVMLEGGVWRRKSDGVIAGSALTMTQGIKNLVTWGYTLPHAVRCATTNPAHILHLKNRGQLAAGFQADITLLNSDFSPKATLINGRAVNA